MPSINAINFQEINRVLNEVPAPKEAKKDGPSPEASKRGGDSYQTPLKPVLKNQPRFSEPGPLAYPPLPSGYTDSSALVSDFSKGLATYFAKHLTAGGVNESTKAIAFGLSQASQEK